jgi:hypothetical protein
VAVIPKDTEILEPARLISGAPDFFYLSEELEEVGKERP